MISNKMQKLLNNNSVIREMFEEGKKLKKIYGDKNVYDFSLGNPSVLPPKKINDVIKNIIDNEDPFLVHGYMSNSGYEDVREKIANYINKKYNTNFSFNNIIMTVGAASGLNITLKSVINDGDEVIVFAPYFSEYNNYIENYNGKVIKVNPDNRDFQPDLEDFERKITSNTKAVIMNSPNNPTGVIYKEEVIKLIAEILNKKQDEYGHEIYLISDEPYREIVYNNAVVPFITKYYNNTFVVYSFSKSLSLSGERIGYVLVSNLMNESEKIIEALTIANRISGAVNAPSLMQRVVAECLDEEVDINQYEKNCNLLYEIVKQAGFEALKPEGAFYLFMKSPIEDDKEFCQVAKKYNLLFVPVSSFSYSGYVRIAYCVSYDVIENSREAFMKLGKYYFQK